MENQQKMSPDSEKVLRLMQQVSSHDTSTEAMADVNYDELFQPWNTTQERSYGVAHSPNSNR